MTDEIDRMMQDADPYRPGLLARLNGAEQTLLEEIMSAPKLESVPATPSLRRTLTRRLGGAVAAAAVVTGVIAAVALLPEEPESSPYAGPVGLPSAGAGTAAISGWELDLKAAEGHPRLIINEPGWKVTTVYGFADEQGTIAFEKGDRQLEMNWYPAKYYQSYYKDRLLVSAPEPTTVAGRKGDVFTYDPSDFETFLKPKDGATVALRSSGGWTRSSYDEVLSHVVHVGAEAFLAALPPEIVTPSRVREEAAKILVDVPLPPGFDIESVGAGGANDRYQFGADVTGQISCAWIAEWIRADKAGDDKAVDQAAAALRSSRKWKVLLEMKDQGGWSQILWETTGKVADGKVPNQYEQGLGCDR
ncbi:hypothetical protein [Actinoplanes sp. GCM10030250]|uniref:hypothetical protein n=1 Tax=Actinoplanes sp. GCM10030250 TaxID=3273376 RepID=UPI003613B1CF